MTQNDIEFLDNLYNLNSKIANASDYVKENYGVDASYDEETQSILLSVENVNESALELVEAKNYFEEIFDNYLNIKY